jgi:hypothetical protein
MAKLSWHRVSGLMGCCALVFSSSMAMADAGEGIQNEYLILHAGVDVMGGVNTNLFFQDSDEASPGAIPVLRIQPKLSITNQKETKVHFDLNWRIAWSQYLDSQDAILRQSGLNTLLGAGVTLNPQGSFSFRLTENFTRTNEAPNNPGADPINRVVNRVGAKLGIHPGGRVFQGYLSYHWSLYDFSKTLESLNKMEHDLQGRFVWQFLPRTAAMLTTTYSIISYDSPFRTTAAGVPTTLPNVDSTPLRIQGGLSSLLTNGLALTLLAGYGWAFYETGPSTNQLLFTGQLAYLFGQDRKSKVSFEYDYGFRDASVGNFYTAHTLGLNYSQLLLNEALRLDAGAGYVIRDYVLINGVVVPLSNGGTALIPSTIQDNLVSASASVNYNFAPWLEVAIDYGLRANMSDSNVSLISGQEDIAGRSYIQHVLMLRFGFQY